MTLESFTEKFFSCFTEADAEGFAPVTKFKELKEWSSIQSLTVIAMIDEEYNVEVKGDDIHKSSTIEELYNIVKSKM